MADDGTQTQTSAASDLATFNSHQPPEPTSPSTPAESSSVLPNSEDRPTTDGHDTSVTLLNGEVSRENKQANSHDTALQVIDLGPVVEGSDLISDGVVGLSDGSSQDEEVWDHDVKRVKVYQLTGSRWVDHGTAFCYGNFQEDTGDALLVARAETDHENIILSTTIRPTDVYQRQQDTLIVWTEPDGADYALSFQDAEGCLEVWNFILEVQRYLNGPDQAPTSSPFSMDNSITTASIIRLGHLPQPQLGNIGEIDKAVKALARTQAIKERLCEYIQREEYIKSLIAIMSQAEDLESLEDLHALCSLMQTILMMNDHNMYEHILNDEIFFGVIGMLEYEPEFPTHKGNYREFFNQTLRFHQPIPIPDETIQRKIHHAYRLLFLKDVVLVRVLDDSTFNVLNSCILFNQIDIINHIQHDPAFLRDVVRLYVDEDMLNGGGVRQPPSQLSVPVDGAAMALDQESTGKAAVPEQTIRSQGNPVEQKDLDTQREVVLLIQQLCVMGKNVQLPARLSLFRSLVDQGILFAVQWALSLPETEESSRPMINAAGEILSALLDHDLPGVRCHVVKQVSAIEKEVKAGKKGAEKAETLLMALCRIMARSNDLIVQCIVGDSLKTWLEVPLSDTDPRIVNGIKNLHRDDAGTEKFLDYFYQSCINVLFEPFHHVQEWRTLKEPVLHLSREKTNRYLYLCDLLHNFEMQHSFRSHVHILGSDVSVRVASLLRSKDKHLRHAAFRFFRACLRPNAVNLRNYFMKRDIFRSLLELTLQESRRDNLLSSSCREFFEHIRRENIKDLINHCMTSYEPLIRKLTETALSGQRFQLFIRRWEMNNEPPPPESSDPLKNLSADPRRWPSQSRHLEAEEENYFNADDDDDLVPLIRSQSPHATSSRIFAHTIAQQPQQTLKRKRRVASSAPKGLMPQQQQLPQSRSAPLSTLLDYGEEEDDEGEIGPMPLAPSPEVSTTKRGSESFKPTDPPLSPLMPMVPRSRPPRRSLKPVDDDERIFEALIKGKVATSAALSAVSPPPTDSPGSSFVFGPHRPNEKRRRDDHDDEDDEMLDKLRSQLKKRNRSAGASPPSAIVPLPKNGSKAGTNGTLKTGDDPPSKKIKVKLGARASALAAMSGVQSIDSSAKAEESTRTASPNTPNDMTVAEDTKSTAKDGDRG